MPEYDEYTIQNRSWTRLFILFSLLLLLGVLIWAVFFRTSPPSTKSSHGTTTAQSPATSSQSTTQNSPQSSSPPQTSKQPPASSNTQTQQTNTLANTGPGSTFSTFVGVSVIGVFVARRYIKRALGNANRDIRP